MLKVSNNDKTIYFSEEHDWSDKSNNVIAVWAGANIPENEYEEVLEYFNSVFGYDVEFTIIGSFQGVRFPVFVFLVKKNVAKFGITRFGVQGLRWWYDLFSKINGGFEVEDKSFNDIIDKLGLTIKEVSILESDDDDE